MAPDGLFLPASEAVNSYLETVLLLAIQQVDRGLVSSFPVGGAVVQVCSPFTSGASPGFQL